MFRSVALAAMLAAALPAAAAGVPPEPIPAAAPAAEGPPAPAPEAAADPTAPAVTTDGAARAAAAADDAAADRILWLVQPLAPGHDHLVGPTEAALGKLLAASPTGREVVGRSQLASLRPDTAAVTDCLFGDAPCPDPVGALVQAYGFRTVVLIKAGLEGGHYRFRAASFRPGAFGGDAAESADASLEQALRAVIVRVAPVDAILTVESDPPGAALVVDGAQVGVTPLTTVVAPGERAFRLELGDHDAIEWKKEIPLRGVIHEAHRLDRSAGRLVVTSEGATIVVDGEVAGTGSVELALAPGTHQLLLEADGHHPWSGTVEVEPGRELRVERRLEPTGWTSFGRAISREAEKIYARGTYLSVSYDTFTFVDDKLAARALESDKIESDSVSPGTSLWGVSVEYGSLGRYFGLMTFGASYFQNAERVGVGLASVATPANGVSANIFGGELRLLHPQLRLALWRFVLGVKGGFVGRAGYVESLRGPRDVRRGFALADVGIDAQGGLAFFVVDGLYLEGAYRHSFTLAGSTEGTQALRGGIGYAF